MSQLHQVLAVRDDLKNKSNLILNETRKTFSSKGDHFDGLTKAYTITKDGTTAIPTETKELVTTVKDKLEFTLESVINSIDVDATVSETNASATAQAELKVGDTSFGVLSAITLLDLEKTLTNLRSVYGEIPTQDPTKSWKDNGKNVPNTFVTDPAQVTYRSEKSKKVITLAEATEKFPAQAQVFDSEEQVGFYTTVGITGKITPTKKSELLQSIDDLILAVKDARARANNVPAKDTKLGQKLINFINAGL